MQTKISSIKHVCLEKNYISSLWGSHFDNEKDDSGLLSIPHLDLTSNILKEHGIIEIFSTLHLNKTLLHLNISCNDVSNIGAVAISECLKSNNTLQELNLSHTKLFDEGITVISNSLKTNRTLKVLHLTGNDISNKGALKIAEGINSNATLGTLNISKNWIHKKGIMAILKANTALHKLECAYNTLGRSDFIAITDYVRANKSTVQTLNISYNEVRHCHSSFYVLETVFCCNEDDLKRCMLQPKQYITPITDIELIKDIITCCIKDRYAERLIIEGKMYYYQFDLLKLISEAIQENKSGTLTKILIKQVHMNSNNTQAIINCLKAESLQEIEIRNSIISSAALKGMLEMKVFLHKLDFSQYALQDDDRKTINMFLKSCKSMQQLILNPTRVSDIGVKILAEAVVVNMTLLILDVSSNPISDVGASAISKCLMLNEKLQCLNLSEHK